MSEKINPTRLFSTTLAERLDKAQVSAKQVSLIIEDSHSVLEKAQGQIVAAVSQQFPDCHFLTMYSPASQIVPDGSKSLPQFVAMASSSHSLSGMLSSEMGKIYQMTLDAFIKAGETGRLTPALKHSVAAIGLLRALNSAKHHLISFRETLKTYDCDEKISRHFGAQMSKHVLTPLENLTNSVEEFIMGSEQKDTDTALNKLNNEISILIDSFRWELVDNIGSEQYRQSLPSRASG